MMETFLEDAEYSLHHRNNPGDGTDRCSQCSGSGSDSDDPMDDPFLYDKFLPDPDWTLRNRLAEEEETKSKNLVDPGPFRYNKRVFLSCLPGLLVIFALGGEGLVFMVAVGTAVITTMSQLGDSRRCVVMFMMFFIPTHVYVLSVVIPLLWLSGWHLLSVVAINMFVILTAGWVIIQFKAFRMEEPQLAALIELVLFTLYPLLSCGLLCWSLASVIKPSIIPIIFSITWFVQLQIYLIPTLSSFRTNKPQDTSGAAGTSASGASTGASVTVTGIKEENLDVLQVPMVIMTVVAFVLAGPFLYIFVTVMSAVTLLSWMSLVHLIFMLSLTLFLLSLLSIRQVFEYLGLPYTMLIVVRWVGGVTSTLLCYPVLHDYGLDSHFLPLLPVAIAMFAALGVVLSMKKRKVIMAFLTTVLVTSLIALFLVWIQRMPHNLPHYFLGYLPLNVLYLLISINFLFCLLCMGTISVGATAPFGSMMCLQAAVLTVCEVSLHNAGLYSTSLIQLSSLSALYAIHRLQLAEKVARQAAISSSAIHLAKSVAGASSLVLDKTRGEITTLEMCSLSFMMYAFVSVFMYSPASEKSAKEVFQDLCLLLCGLAASAHHLLLPVSLVLFAGSHSYTYVLGLWCMVGAALTLLYTQLTVASGVKVGVLKVSLALAVLGTAVLVLHPRLAFSFFSLFQWLEMVNYVVLAGVFSSQLSLSPQHSVLLSVPLSVCPAIRICLILWHRIHLAQVVLTSIDVSALLILVFICLTIPEMTEEAEKVIKYSILIACLSCTILLGLDLSSWQPSSDVTSLTSPPTIWSCPAWRALLGVGLVTVVTIKIMLTVKGTTKLPMTLAPENNKPSRFTLPVITNGITIVTFLLACTQGPDDPFLHDLWCCFSAIILGCLHGDQVFLPKISGDKQVAPIVTASAVYLLLASMFRCRLWLSPPLLSLMGGLLEMCLLTLTAPVYYVLWTVLWEGQPWSEPAVVFLMPFNGLQLFVSSSYTGWLCGLTGFLSGCWMMMFRLPMLPYSSQYYEAITHTS